MAKLVGTPPRQRRSNILVTAAAYVNPIMRLKKDMEEGVGRQRLLEVLQQLPDSVTVVVHPTLGLYMHTDFAVIGPGRVMLLCAVHWKGPIGRGRERDEWLGAGAVDLGRPDKRARMFAERLAYSGHAGRLSVEPVVIMTDGPVQFGGPEPEVPVIQWAEAAQILRETFPPGQAPVESDSLAKLLAGR